ncbi:MAG: hypothetical protein QXF28_00840 [Nitrososphaerota archaeon]
MKNVSSSWVILSTSILGSLDEEAVGVGYPFLEIPFLCIIVAVVLENIIVVYFSMFAANWIKNLNKNFLPSSPASFWSC